MKKFASFLVLLSACMFTFAGCAEKAADDSPAKQTQEDQMDAMGEGTENTAGDTEADTSEETGEETTE